MRSTTNTIMLNARRTRREVLRHGATALLASTPIVLGGGSLPTAAARSSSPGSPSNSRSTETHKIARLNDGYEGYSSINNTSEKWQLAGADLGHMFLHKGKIYMVFGDSYAKGPDYPIEERDWRRNVMAVINDQAPEDGLTFESMITDRPGHAKELIGPADIPGAEPGYHVIPTYGVSVDGRIILHFMAVENFGITSGHAGLAYSDDDGQTWQISDVTWPGDSNFVQVAFVDSGPHIYMFGIPNGRLGHLELARVDRLHVLDRSRYQYWDGQGWRTDNPAAAATVVPAPVGELSVRWNTHYGKWLLMTKHQEPDASGDGYGIVYRTADRLTGPWSDETYVLTDEQLPRLYGPFLPPLWNDAPDIFFALSTYRPDYAVGWYRTAL